MQAPPGSGDQANCNTRVVKITKHNEPLGATVRWRYWSSNCTGCLTEFSGLYWKVQMIGNFGWSWAIFVLLGNFGPFKLFWTILGHFGSFGPFWCLWAFFYQFGTFGPLWDLLWLFCASIAILTKLGLLSHFGPLRHFPSFLVFWATICHFGPLHWVISKPDCFYSIFSKNQKAEMVQKAPSGPKLLGKPQWQNESSSSK